MEPIRITTRRAAITLAILLIVAALFLSLGGPEPAAVQKTKWVDLSQTRILDMGGRNTLWVHVEGNLSDEKTANVTVRADLTEGALPRRMVLVDSARAGGSRFGALEDALKGALRPAGWKLDKENLSSLRAEGPGRVIVLPSGAWPSEALDNWTGKFTPDDLIIYMGIRQNISIGSDGTSQVGGVPDALAADGKPAQGYGAPLDILGKYEGPRVARIPHTLDEFMDMDELARAIARYAWEAPENRTIASVEQEWSDGANDLTANLSRDVSRGALRVRLIGPDGQPFKLWDRDLSRLPGEIDGPDRIVRAQTAAFQVRLRPDYPQKEELEYDLHIYSIDGKAWTEERIGRGAVGLAAAGEGAWVGSFLVSEWPGPGMTRLEITDQFGRALAQAVVKIPQITITALDADSLTRRYLILQNGEPIAQTSVRVRRANSSEWTTRPASGGIVSVSAKFAPGAQTLLFDLGGQTVSYSWDENEGGAWAVAWTYGIPGIGLAVLVYVFLRPRRRPTYRLVVPEMATGGGGELPMSMKDLAKALDEAGGAGRSVLRADELAVCLQTDRLEDGRVIGPESVEEALRKLEKTGRAVQWKGHWACKRTGFGKEDARRQGLARVLKDKLLESGISLGGMNRDKEMKDGNGRTWAIGPDSAKGLARMAESRRLPSCILFADRTEREETEKGLMNSKDGRHARLRVAMQTGRTKLVSLEEI